MMLRGRWAGLRRRWIVLFRVVFVFEGDVRIACCRNGLGGRNPGHGGWAVRTVRPLPRLGFHLIAPVE